jgi:hypothetical protein
MRRRVKQPFRYGRYVVLYKENQPKSLPKTLKKEIDTIEEAQKEVEILRQQGYIDVGFHKVR